MRFHPALMFMGVGALLLSGAPAHATDPPTPDTPTVFTAEDRAQAREITLITGDTVVVTPDGESGFLPAPGREGVGHVSYFTGSGADRDHYVVPNDAVGRLNEGVLDSRLFNVTDLIAGGFADTGVLPVIVRDAPGEFDAATASGGLWDKVADGRVDHVWLDGKATFTLAESVPQIGAPTAWESGYTGEGVTVAILDGGYDPTHPDLAGRVKAARDFTGTSPEALDGHGHGTHVASTVAGSGAASSGKYKGVAPDADLLVGKVCTDDGFCEESSIIAGMEWAAANGADVLNMSLGGYPTDGTDPLSLAVNEITARTGMLMVIAAGNFGCSGCVGAPGAADAALTVGSVTKSDELSEFSSQGPRVGDGAVKPDITAPGSAITAARANGTGMGTPVDANYTTADGTSMATPHVAGAVALLKQVHPDWDAPRLKAALMGSSKGLEGLGVFEQGAGRVDMAAVSAAVTPDVGSVSFGSFAYPHTQDPAAKNVTYINDTGADIELALAVTGDPMFTVNSPKVTVPAHGTATVSVSAQIAGATIGNHGAFLTAKADGVSVRTAVGAVLEPEMHDLDIDVTTRNGGPVVGDPGYDSGIAVVFGLDNESWNLVEVDADGHGTVRLEPGRYQVGGIIEEGGDAPALTSYAEQVTIAHDDVTSVVDLRAGELIDADLDADDAVLDSTYEKITALDADGEPLYSHRQLAQDGTPSYSVPNADPGTGYLLTHGATYGSPEGSANPYAYNLFFTKTGSGMPGRTTFTAHDSELAREDAVYHSQGVDTVGRRSDWYQDLDVGPVFNEMPDVPVPSRRTEYYTPGTWDGTFQLGETTFLTELAHNHTVRTVGTAKNMVWGQAPLGVGEVGNIREDDYVSFIPAMYDDSNPESWLTEARSTTVTGSASLTVDGKEMALDLDGSCWLSGTLPAGTAGTFVYTCDTTRVNEFSAIGTASSATWTFHSEPGEPGTVGPMPMLGVRLASPAVVDGYAPNRHALTFDVFRTDTTAALGTKKLTFEVSYDDGKTWQSVPLLRTGDHASAWLDHPKGATFVSTRITAADGDGNSVTQKTIRSFAVG